MRSKFQLRRQLVFLRHLFWDAYRHRILVSIVCTSVFATLITILNHQFYDIGFWDSFQTKPDIQDWFCEYTDMKKLIRQPINTFTNFVYLVLGMYFLSKGFEDTKRKRNFNLITANHFYSFIVAIIMFYTFIFSSFFHSSLVEVASHLDFSAVYSISLFALMYLMHRFLLVIRGLPTTVKYWKERLVFFLFFSLLYLVLTFVIPLHYVHPIVGTIILVIVLLGFYLEIHTKGVTNKGYLTAMALSIFIALVLFEMDIAKLWCSPHSLFNPHAFWHLFNGLSIFFFYLYIRSENYNPDLDLTRTTIRARIADKQR